MLKYVNFLLFNIMRKWAVWVLLALSLVVTYFVIWIQIHELEKYSIKFVDSINIYTKMMPFIFGISFISMIIVYVFKDGEDDGSDLLIISKPISRGKILLGKFVVIALFILFFNVIYFATTFIAAQGDSLASMNERFKFAASIFLGGIIVSFIVGTIIVFAASFLSKMGALAIGIVSAAVVPIVSQVVVAVSKGVPTQTTSDYNRKLHIINYQETENIVENTLENFIQTGEPGVNIADLTEIERRQYQAVFSDHTEKMNKYIEEVWYDKAAYIDPWYQLSGFYDLFVEKAFLSADPEELKLKYQRAHIDADESIETATSGQRLSVPVDIMTGNEIDVNSLMANVLDILSGTKKVLILTKKPIDTGNPGEMGSMPWKELIANFQMWKHGKPLDAKFKPTPVIKFFTDSKYSFEDRVRAISTSDNYKDGKFLADAHVGALDSYSLQEYLTHTLILDALKNSTKFLNRINHMKVSSAMKAQAALIVNMIQPYQAPTEVYDFYKPMRDKGVTFTNKADAKDANGDPVDTAGFYDFFNAIEDPHGHPYSPAAINNYMKAFNAFQPAGVIADGDERWIATTKPYVSRTKTLEIWAIIGLFFMIITGIRYWRKDIK